MNEKIINIIFFLLILLGIIIKPHIPPSLNDIFGFLMGFLSTIPFALAKDN